MLQYGNLKIKKVDFRARIKAWDKIRCKFLFGEQILHRYNSWLIFNFLRNSFRFCPGSRTHFNEVLPRIFEFELCPWIGRKYQTRCLRCSVGTIAKHGLKGHPISIARPITTEYCFACRILSTAADTSWWQIRSLLTQKRPFITYGS